MNKSELENLSRLIFSLDSRNILIGLELLTQYAEAIPDLRKELLIVWQLNKDRAIKSKAENLLLLKYTKDKIGEWKKDFTIFHQYRKLNKRMITLHENSRSEFEELIKKNDEYVLYYSLVAEYLVKNKKFFELAEKYFSITLDVLPNHINTLYALALNCFSNKKKHFPKAIECYKKILTQDPKHISSLLNLIKLYQELNQPTDAYHCIKTAQQTNPSSMRYKRLIIINCIFYLPDEKYFDEVEEYFKEDIEKNGDYSAVWTSWGSYKWLAKKDYQGAIEAYKKGIEVDPNCIDNYGNIAELYVDVFKNYEKGWEEYKKIASKDGGEYHLINIISLHVLHLKNITEGKKYYIKLREEQQSNQKLNHHTAKQWKSFLDAEKKLHKLFPELKKYPMPD